MNAASHLRISRGFGTRIVCGLVLAGFVATAQASDVVLATDSPTIGLGIGDMVNVEVRIDFSDIPGGTLGGGLDIDFDSSTLTVSSLSSAGLGEAVMGRDPDETAGLLESWAVGDFQGLAGEGQVLLGTVSFRVIGIVGTDTQISVSPTSGIGGPWISGDDYVSELAPGYNQITITFDPDHVYGSGFEGL